MDKLISDSAKTEISNKVMDILRAYHISNWHSEPYHQNQNPSEWRYRTIKSWTNTVMNRSGTPANCWLLCLIYVFDLLIHIAHLHQSTTIWEHPGNHKEWAWSYPWMWIRWVGKGPWVHNHLLPLWGNWALRLCMPLLS